MAFSPDNRRIVMTGTFSRVMFVQTTWDVETGECLAQVEAAGDAAAIAAGNERCPLLVVTEGAIESTPQARVLLARTGETVVCFPAFLWCITSHPDGWAWTGSSGRHLYYFRLEGDVPIPRSGGAPATHK